MILIVNLNSLKMCALKCGIILFLIFVCLLRISRPTCSVSKNKNNTAEEHGRIGPHGQSRQAS